VKTKDDKYASRHSVTSTYHPKTL